MTYYLDTRLSASESTHTFVGNQLHACPPIPRLRHYAFVIRDRRRQGWVFRFTPAQERDALQILAGLNAYRRAAA